MQEYDFENMIQLSHDHLLYLDDEGIQQCLSLPDSARHLSEQVGQLTDLLGNPVSQPREPAFVCRADKAAEKPYFEFYDEQGEAIRFVLNIRPGFLDYFRMNWKNRFYEKFDQLEKQLLLSGYHLYEP